MIGFYNYTVILTYIGLISTVFGITQLVNGNYMIAIFCLLISGICDMFDGVVARGCKTRSDLAKKFGIQIDSLCDVICFGVFPGIFNYIYTVNTNSSMSGVATVITAFYVLAAVIRLGYFNVMEEERVKSTSEPRQTYQGMPVTTVAGFLPMLYMFKQRIESLNIDFDIVLNVFILICGFLFIINFPVPKAHKKGIIVMSAIATVMLVVLILQYCGVTSF